MKISTAIEERVPGGLCVVNDSIQLKKNGRDLYSNNLDRPLQAVQGKVIGLDLKHTECKIMAFDIRGSAGLSATEDRNERPAVMADQEKPVYANTRSVVDQYGIDKASLQIPRIIINKYREAEGYKRPAAGTLQIYA